MADTQQIDTRPSGSLPADMLNPPDPLGFSPIPQAVPTPSSGLPQSHYDPIVASLAPTPSSPQPAPTVPPAAPPPPASAAAAAPAPAPATPPPAPPPAAPAPPPSPAAAPAPAPSAPPPAAPAQPVAPAAAPSYTYIGDSLAAGLAGQQKAHQTYEGRDIPSARANGSILAASGRTTAETLRVLSANSSKLSGQNVVLSTGLSNDLNGGIPLDQAMTNVASQLDALRKAGANVTLLGVGAGVRDAQAANARLAQLAQAYGIPFTGEIADTQAADGQPGTVHPRNQNYGDVFKQVQASGPQAKGPPPDVLDGVVEHIRAKEAGGPFILVGHEGHPYDPKLMPVKPGYYGFPDWQGWGDSHAAGTGQFQPDTWKKAVEGIIADGKWTGPNPPDFRNPDDQWKVFRYWAGRRYKELTGSDLEADARAGKVNYGALGPEWTSLKGAGIGSPDEVTASTLPGFKEWQAARGDERRLMQEESEFIRKQMAAMEAGTPEQRALADQLLHKQLQLMDKYEQMIAHPPTQRPHDAISNFGSIATLVGIFAGRFANRPMVASLNAAGAAMEAINQNDRQAYVDAFNQWKLQADMTQNLLSMESGAYKNIMEDERLTLEEKFKRLEMQMHIFQNEQGIAASIAGDYEKMWGAADKVMKTNDDHAKAVADVEETHARTEKLRHEAETPLLGTGQERAAIETELAAQAQAEAAHPPPGGARTLEQLEKDPQAIQAAREKIAHKSQRDDLLGTGDERAGILTELGVQAADEAKNHKEGDPAPRTVEELAKDPVAVAAARKKYLGDKGAERLGPDISDDDARVRAGQLLAGDTSGMIRLSQRSRDKVYDAARDMVMPQMVEQLRQELGRDPTDDEKKVLLGQVGTHLAASQAEFRGFTQYERSIAIREAAIDIAIQEAQKFFPLAEAASEKVGRSSLPTVNRAILTGKYEGGDENVVQFTNITNAVLSIYARAVTPTGQATDQVREMARQQLATAFSQGQYKAALDMMRLEMDNAQQAPAAARSARREEFLRGGGQFKPDTPFLRKGVGDGSSLPQIDNQADYDKLPSGAHFMSNGVEHVKP